MVIIWTKKFFSNGRSTSSSVVSEPVSEIELSDENKSKLKEISKKIEGTGKAILLDSNFDELKEISAKSVGGSLRRIKNVVVIVIDGVATSTVIKASEENNVQAIVAKNFQTTDTSIKLLSL